MKPFIPPKDDDIDYNPEIDMMIEEEIERRPFNEEEDLDIEDADDLKFINIG